ncbi:octicosapeptide/Phox/Bem1p (PB1) domain-containing protein / tetratricopeptide repeat (TPR)-containing protein [Carex rostrata]
MGKPTTRKKKSSGGKPSDTSSNHSSKVLDQDMAIFIDMSNQLREDGNKLLQRKDFEGAIKLYEKAIKLLPKNHKDIALLHTNMATCYMKINPVEYHRAINECNLALEFTPKYSKALLKRAQCFEALNRLDLAYRDVQVVLSMEPKNTAALEISERVKKAMEANGIALDEKEIVGPRETVVPKEKPKKKKRDKSEKTENKLFVKEEKKLPEAKEEEVPMKAVKLVFGDDIRNAQIPGNCTIFQLMETVRSKFPGLKAVLVKYKDKEGDLVTITTSDELRFAQESSDEGSVRLYVTEANPEQELVSEEGNIGNSISGSEKNQTADSENCSVRQEPEDWIIQFGRLFKNHVGLDSDSYLDLHDLGIKLYSEAMEETVTSEEAQEIFQLAEKKYQEMAALAFFNWGNVHMSRARKMLYLPEDYTKESIAELVKSAFEWAQSEYIKAEKMYEESLRVDPGFYEAHLALGQQFFEQAKLNWYYEPSADALELFNKAEENMERGMEMWEKTEEIRLKNISKPNEEKILLDKINLGAYFRDVSTDEAAELAANMRSQINILWGTMLYERSVMEFKLGIPTFEECLMEAVEKFKLAGASPTDIAVMIKNHCAHETAQEGFGFKIDEIIQAWNEMYDAKRWSSGIPSFRLEPLFRRRTPRLHHVLEHIHLPHFFGER